VAGTCEYGEEPSGSKNAGNFFTSCRTSWLLKKDYAPWSKQVLIRNTLLPTVSFYKTVRDLYISRPCVSRFYSLSVGEATYVEFMSMSEDKTETAA